MGYIEEDSHLFRHLSPNGYHVESIAPADILQLRELPRTELYICMYIYTLLLPLRLGRPFPVIVWKCRVYRFTPSPILCLVFVCVYLQRYIT